MRDWQTVRIGDHIKIKHGYAFEGEGISDVDNGNILVTPGNFDIGGGFKSNKFKFYAGLIPDEYIFQAHDLVVTMTDLSKEGDTLGYPAFIPSNPKYTYLHNQRVGKVIFEDDFFDKRFLYYLFCTDEYRHEVLASATGTSIKHTSPKRIEHFSATVPLSAEQKAVAAVLGVLDDKIELNRRMNATLEAMARALFKSWFVDFDPVRAKMEDKQPFGMDAATAALFPSRLVPSPLGDIPEGWSISNVGTEFDITMGQSPPGETYNESGEGLPFYQGRTDFGFRYPTRRIFCTQPNRVAEAGDTLISVRAPVGDINMAFEKCILGRGVGALRHKSKARSFTYYAIHSIQEDIKAFEADGTVFGSINKQDVEKLSIIKPSPEAIKEFEKIITSTDEKILSNIKEILELEKQRDYLLPKLISGDIRIPDAEKFIEGVL